MAYWHGRETAKWVSTQRNVLPSPLLPRKTLLCKILHESSPVRDNWDCQIPGHHPTQQVVMDHISMVPRQNPCASLHSCRRNISHCPERVKSQVYLSIVRPKLEYSASIWDSYTKKDIDCLESVQWKAARFAVGDFGHKSSVTSMIDKLNWLSLQHWRKSIKAILFYKAVSNEVEIPMPIGKQDRCDSHKYIPPVSWTNIISTRSIHQKHAFGTISQFAPLSSIQWSI